MYDKYIQKITKPEDSVVLECVDKLLEKGYKPENIILEKVYPSGHGTSGRLDICVNKEDGSEYLLIECKTYGKEFEKEFARIKKDGGQLFTYFKFSNKADLIMLYASELKGNKIVSKNEIVKIEEDYRTGDVKDFYDKWNKLSKDNGVFDSWVQQYNFKSKSLTINELEDIRPEDSSFIFNRFLEILRHNVVSDKPNAFNKIFTLFLCKIYDEKSKEGTDGELGFQWIEGKDDDVSFQLRLTDLYKNGMKDFLEKEVTDFSDEDFDSKYASLFGGDERLKKRLKDDIAKLRLEKNNEFAIKEVYDQKSFKENAKVVKEVVELLQNYKIRYTNKQQYLSDFFELLLTTGLKQESGQFFTPVPIAQFVIKSLPIDAMVYEKLGAGKKDDLLPFVMDYAAGSGHFLTESMHEIQRLLLKADTKKLKSEANSFIHVSKIRHFDWALQYVYGIEKDYRLVKVGKVGCYLHGDGLANVIHSDGLARFNHPDYKGKLKISDKDFPQDNKQFEILVSNPPYSVSAFKNAAREYYREPDFGLYGKLTDNSSEIECLFIERTKQLLKDGGVAGVILPSSILSNTGIYSKSREIILQYFDIVAITELGSNTFMATGTNTVILFLRRRNNYVSKNLKFALNKFFKDSQDVTLNGVEKPVTKYVNHVWEGLRLDDYVSLLKQQPNKAITEHEIYIEYQKKLKDKKEFWNLLLEIEAEKLFYFILAYPQKVVLVKSGEKEAEKGFLGYEFSNRRGSEGIHPMQRGKNIEDCTQMFDAEIFDNPTKASTYIYKAFAGDYDFAIDEAMQKHVDRIDLVDMLTFDRVEFEKKISLSVKKKMKIESKWELVRIGDVLLEQGKSKIQVGTAKDLKEGKFPFYTSGESILTFNDYLVENENIFLSTGGSALVKYYNGKAAYSTDTFVVKSYKDNVIKTKYIFHFLESIVPIINEYYFKGVGLKHLQKPDFRNIQIPLPPLDVQQKIVSEIEVLEAKEKKAKEEVEKLKIEVDKTFENSTKKSIVFLLRDIIELQNGKDLSKSSRIEGNYFIYGGNGILGRLNEFLIEKPTIAIGRVGAYCGAIHLTKEKSWITDNSMFVSSYLKETDIKFLYLSLKKLNLNQFANAASHPNISQPTVLNQKIPLPPLSEQQKIVSEIEKIEAKINSLETEIASIPKEKETILKKYL